MNWEAASQAQRNLLPVFPVHFGSMLPLRLVLFPYTSFAGWLLICMLPCVLFLLAFTISKA